MKSDSAVKVKKVTLKVVVNLPHQEKAKCQYRKLSAWI
jgi:hypothetical protein